MLTGQYQTPDGVDHPHAVGLCYPLVLQTWPIANARAGFDFNVWHDLSALEADKKPIIQLSFSVTGEDLMMFIGATQALVLSDISLIDAAVAQMEGVVLAHENFQLWKPVFTDE